MLTYIRRLLDLSQFSIMHHVVDAPRTDTFTDAHGAAASSALTFHKVLSSTMYRFSYPSQPPHPPPVPPALRSNFSMFDPKSVLVPRDLDFLKTPSKLPNVAWPSTPKLDSADSMEPHFVSFDSSYTDVTPSTWGGSTVVEGDDSSPDTVIESEDMVPVSKQWLDVDTMGTGDTMYC